MSKKLLCYYLVLALIVGSQLISAMYQGSLVVFHSQELHQLTVKKQELTQQQLTLQSELSRTQSLTALAQSPALDGFQVMSRPLSIQARTSVALNSL